MIQSEMEQWSILSNVVNCMLYGRYPKNFHNLNISTVNKEKYKRNSNIELEERHMLELDFWRHTGEIEGRISRCIQRDSIRNIRHYKNQ